MRKKSFVLFPALLFICNLLAQTSWIGLTSTDWRTASNWTAGIPTATVDAIIGDASFTGAFQPALTGAPVCKSLTIGTGAIASTLTIVRNITISGNVTIGANGTILHNTANRTITLSGNWSNSGTYSAPISSAGVTFSGTSQTLTGATTFHRLTVNAGSTLTLANNIIVNTALTVSGTLDPTASYAVSGTGTLAVNSGGTIKVMAADFTTNYALSGIVTLNGAGTVNYASSVINQNVSNAYTYGYLRISGGMTKSLTGNLPDLNATAAGSGRMYIDAGTLDLLTYTANRAIGVAGGTITIAAGGLLKIGGTNSLPANYNTKTFAATSTVEYNGTTQTIAAATYGHLTFSSSSGVAVKTMPVTAMTIAGNFTSSAGAGTGVTFTAGNNITVNRDVSLDASTTFDGASFTHTFRGSWANNGTFTGSTSSVTFNGVNAALSGSGSNNFNNLSFSASGITAAAATAINVAGNLATTGSGVFTHTAGGTLTMSGTTKTVSGNGFRLANYVVSGTITTAANITISGNVTVNGSFAASAGTITMSGTSKTISGSGTITLFSVVASGTITTANDFTILGNLSVSFGGSFTASAGTATCNGTTNLSGTTNLFHVTINATKTLRMGTNSVLGIAGTFTKTGTLNVTTNVPNTVQYNSSGAQSIVSTTYNNLILANGGTKTAAGAITVNNDLTINSGVTFDASSYTFSLYRHFTNNGTFTASTSDVQLRGANAANITGVTSFYKLTINKSSAALWVTLINNITVTNNLTLTQGNMQTGSHSVTVTGSRLGTGTGIILGTITQNHAFTSGTPYYFEGPNNIITFTSPSVDLTSVTVTVILGEISDFDPAIECILREYDITIPAGTYTDATLRFHYQDNELNAFDEPFLEVFKYNSGVLWDNLGVNTRDGVNNYIEKTAIPFATGLAGRWTSSGTRNVVRWNGSVSSSWGTAANWTTVSGSDMSNRVPTATDAAYIGDAAFTNNPEITSAQTVNVLRYGSVQGSTLTISSGSLTTIGSVRGNWTSSASHTLDVNAGSLISGTNLNLSDGTSGHDILLQIGSGSATITSNLTQSASGAVNFTGNGTLIIGGHYTYTAGTFTCGTGTVEYNGNGSQDVAPVTYNNLSFTKATERATISSPITVNGNLTTSSSGTCELEVAATLTVAGNITIGANTTLFESGTQINVGGNWTTNGAFTVSNGSVNFNGTGSQSVNANTFNNIIVNKSSGTLSLTGDLVINSDLTLTSGTLDLSTYVADRSNVGGVLTLDASATLKIGANNFPSNYVTNTLNSTSTVEYNGTVAQNVADVVYGNLSFTGGGATPKSLIGNAQINGDLLINSGATVDPDIYTITLNGNMTNDGTFTPSTSTLILTGTSKTISGSSALTLNNLTASAGTYTVSNSTISIAGNLFVDVAPSSLSFGTGTVSLDGDLTNKGSLTSSGTLNISGTRVQTLSLIGAITSASTGIVNFNGTVLPITNSTSSPSFYTVNINNTGGTFAPIQPWTVALACNIASGVTVDFGALNHNFYGDFTNNGTVLSSGKLKFSPGSPFPTASGTVTLRATGATFTSTGEVEFAGTAPITLAGIAPTLNNVTVTNTNAAGVTPNVNWTIGQDVLIGPGATFNGGAALSHSIAGNMTNNGTLSGGTSTITYTGNPSYIDGIGTGAYNNLTIASAANLILNKSLSIGGNLVVDGILTATGRTVTFSGSGNSTISGLAGSLTLEDMTQNKTGGATTSLSIPLIVTGELSMTDGVINTSSSNLLTLNDGATSTSGTSTCYVDGPMKKIGDEAFVFPVGDNTYWARIGITAPASATAAFEAQYFDAPYTNTTSITAPLNNVSTIEHWILDRVVGTDNVSATIYWENGARSFISDLSDIVVARFNGTSWVSETQSGGVTGDVTTGTVTSQIIGSFSPIAPGSENGNNILPISLLDFNAIKNQNQVDLSWSTSTETNNDFFTVERSEDAIRFEEIIIKKGAGNSTEKLNYSAIDLNPMEGTSYYRLKQTDFNGTSTYSKTLAVNMQGTSNYFYVTPNPSKTGETANLFFIPGEDSELFLVMYDMMGREVYSKVVLAEKGEGQMLAIDNSNVLSAGIYFIIARSGQSTYKQKLLIK